MDIFSELAIEQCLLQKMPEMFTPEVVFALEPEEIESIAAESEESRIERSRATEKLEVLDRTLKVLHSLDRHKSTGESPLHDHSSSRRLITVPVRADDEAELSVSESDVEDFNAML